MKKSLNNVIWRFFEVHIGCVHCYVRQIFLVRMLLAYDKQNNY